MTNVVYISPEKFAEYKSAMRSARGNLYKPRARDGAEALATYKAKLDAERARVIGEQWRPGYTVHPSRRLRPAESVDGTTLESNRHGMSKGPDLSRRRPAP
jgi:hypothetical protein